MEQNSSEPYEELDLHEEGEKLYNSKQTSTLPSLQIFNTEEPFTTCAESDLKPIVLSNLLHDSDNVVSTISDNSYSNKEAQTNCINPSCKPVRSLDLSQGTNSNCTTMEQSIFSASLFKLSESTFAWNGVSKSKSPKLPVSLNNISAPALLDSGAELNVLDADFAMKAGIVFINTSVVARAANKQTLNVQGQSQTDVTLNCVTEEGSKMISLGIVLIVKGLGIACIIGQPGILSNNIIYLPKKKLIVLAGGQDIHQVPVGQSNVYHSIARANVNATLMPNDSLTYELPFTLSKSEAIAITPKASTLLWMEPSISLVEGKAVKFTNKSDVPVIIKKTDHLADLRPTVVKTFEIPKDCQAPKISVD